MSIMSRYILPLDEIFERPSENESLKLIIISCEGILTEEVYFGDIVSEIFDEIKNKIKIVSTREDFFSSPPETRTQADLDEQNKSNPKQVLKRMNDYLENHRRSVTINNEDEYWLVLDIDDHTSETKIKEWREVLQEAKEKNYRCAISNPFFEIWLLLHHDDVNEDDRKYAVTEKNPYKPTGHFRKRLKKCGAGLERDKEPQKKHYTKEKIQKAVERAEKLHTNLCEEYPNDLGTTVYLLLQEILELDEQENKKT